MSVAGKPGMRVVSVFLLIENENTVSRILFDWSSGRNEHLDSDVAQMMTPLSEMSSVQLLQLRTHNKSKRKFV